MPFAEYTNFDDCVAKNKDKVDPAAYCGKIKAEVEGAAKKSCPCDSIQLIKSDDGHFYIYGPASVEIKDKQNDKIRASALESSLSQLIRRGRLSYSHQDVIVGEILPEATIGGKLYKTQVTHDRMMVLGDIWDDTEASQEARQKSQDGTLKSYSISGQIRKGGAVRVCDDTGCFRDIFKIDQHAVTLCEEGMNPEANYKILQKGDAIQIHYKTFATDIIEGITSSSEDEVHKEMENTKPKPETKPPETEVAKIDVPQAGGDAGGTGGGVEAAIKAMMGMMEKMMGMMGGGAQVQDAQKATPPPIPPPEITKAANVPETKLEVSVSKAEFDKMKAELAGLKDQISKATVVTTPRPDALIKDSMVSPLEEIVRDPARLDKMSLREIRDLSESMEA